MTNYSFLEMVQAAQILSNAISLGRVADAQSLKALGVTDEMASRFNR